MNGPELFSRECEKHRAQARAVVHVLILAPVSALSVWVRRHVPAILKRALISVLFLVFLFQHIIIAPAVI